MAGNSCEKVISPGMVDPAQSKGCSICAVVYSKGMGKGKFVKLGYHAVLAD